MSVYLVSCVKGKTPDPAPARELYRSLWFKEARAFVEKRQATWYILSAQHGLVHPDQILKPYEMTLNGMNSKERKFWAKLVAGQIFKQMDPQPIIFLAGKNYREHLIPLLDEKGFTWETPLARLGIGSQVSWLQHKQK